MHVLHSPTPLNPSQNEGATAQSSIAYVEGYNRGTVEGLDEDILGFKAYPRRARCPHLGEHEGEGFTDRLFADETKGLMLYREESCGIVGEEGHHILELERGEGSQKLMEHRLNVFHGSQIRPFGLICFSGKYFLTLQVV